MISALISSYFLGFTLLLSKLLCSPKACWFSFFPTSYTFTINTHSNLFVCFFGMFAKSLNDSLFPFAHSTLDYLIMRPMIPLLTTIFTKIYYFCPHMKSQTTYKVCDIKNDISIREHVLRTTFYHA